MIHLVTAANRHLYQDALRALHAARLACFIDERGWNLTNVDGGEYDVYDDDQACHLIGFDAQRQIAVSCRIRPTSTGGLIPDHFSHLIADHETPARSPGVYECTRYFCAPRLRGATGADLRAQLHAGMIEHVRDRGGERLLGFSDLSLLTHLRRFSGLNLRPVGAPCDYGGEEAAIAFEIGVAEADLAGLRDQFGLPDRCLFDAPSWLPVGLDTHSLAGVVEVLRDGPSEKVTHLSRWLAQPATRADVAPASA